MRENWFSGLTKHGAILAEQGRAVNPQRQPQRWPVGAGGFEGAVEDVRDQPLVVVI